MERALPGLGILQSVRSGVLPSIAAGEIVEILPPTRASRCHFRSSMRTGATFPRHVRVVMSWLTEILKVAQLRKDYTNNTIATLVRRHYRRAAVRETASLHLKSKRTRLTSSKFAAPLAVAINRGY